MAGITAESEDQGFTAAKRASEEGVMQSERFLA